MKRLYAGIQSVLDLAVSIPHELAIGGGDYDEGNRIAADIDTISKLVMRAQKAFTESGILSKEFCTAGDLEEKKIPYQNYNRVWESRCIFERWSRDPSHNRDCM